MAGENINRKLNIYINDKEVVNSMAGINREIGKTRNALKLLNKGADDYDEQVANLTKTLSELTEKQEEFKSELKLTNKEMSAARDNFANLLGGIAAGDMQAVQTGMLAIRGSIVATTQAAWAFVATPIGAAIAVIAGLGLAAKAVDDFNESIKESNQLLDNLGVDTKLRPAIQGIADTFKVGFEQIAKSIDDMVDLGLVKNEFEALDKIKEGLVKAPDKNEFLSMLQSNGIAAKNLGLQLESVISLNESFEASGANAEAIFGALQKSSSTLIFQSPALKKSMGSAFGAAFTSELLSQVKSGSITYYDALDKIYKKGEEVGISNQKQAQLAKDLFGKSAIAAGGYEMILGNVAAAHGKNTKALTETQKQTQALAESNIQLAQAQNEALKLDGYNRWKNNALLALNSVKKAWYSMISGIVNNKEDLIKQASLTGEVNKLKDEQKNFSDYMALRQKRLGKNFDWEKEKAEHLADVLKRMNDGWTTPDENAAFEFQISVIKNSKNTTVKTKAVDGPSDEEIKASDAAAKSREKQLSDAQKHAEDQLKIENDLQKSLNDSKAKADELKFGLIEDDFSRERALINAEFDKKIENFELNIKKEQEAIDKLKSNIANPATSKDDLVSYKKQLKDRLEIQENYNQAMLYTDQTRDLKLGALQEKYLEKDLQKKEEAFQYQLKENQIRHNNELSSIKTLADAKKVLSNYLKEDEINKITSLEDAKKIIKEKHLQEDFNTQKKHLDDLAEIYKKLLAGETVEGFKILTDEETEHIKKNAQKVALALSQMVPPTTTGGDLTKSDYLKGLSGLDILGSSPEQWDAVFGSLDTAEKKIAAVATVVGGLQNAFGMYFQFVEAGEKRNLQKFETASRKKKDALSDQLDKGIITQEVYNARVAKIDSELAKKKAELEYKQAKRQKAMQIANIIASTAMSIMSIWSTGGGTRFADFGISAGILTGIASALGAAQLGLVLAQPLPDKNGFHDGGYTGSGNERNSPGPVHYDEYVIPKKVLFGNDPVVPNIVGYLEAKRTGKEPNVQDDGRTSTTTSQGGSVSASTDIQVVNALNRNSAILEKIEDEGLKSYLVNDYQTAKKMRDKIKEVTKLETNAKP